MILLLKIFNSGSKSNPKKKRCTIQYLAEDSE